MLRLILVLVTMLLPLRALADGDRFTFNVGLFYDDREQVEQNEKSATNELVFMVGGGYAWSNGFYLGAKYYRDKLDQKGSAAGSETVTALGPTIGFMRKNLIYITGSYLLAPTKLQEATAGGQLATRTLKGGTGTLLELGYPLAVNSSFCLGPIYSQLKTDYKKSDTTGNGTTTNESLTGTWSDSWSRLGFGMWFNL